MRLPTASAVFGLIFFIIVGICLCPVGVLARKYERRRRAVAGRSARREGETFEPQRLLASETVGAADSQPFACGRFDRGDDSVGRAAFQPPPVEPCVGLVFVEDERQRVADAQQPFVGRQRSRRRPSGRR